MKFERFLTWLFWAVLVFFIVILISPVVYADNGHGHDHGATDVNVDVVGGSLTTGDTTLSGGDVSIGGGGDTFAFAHGMGDVDINQCMGSEQWSTILVGKQKLVANLWCMAESYDARGLHRMAALMRCDIDVIGKHFESNEECLAANTVNLAPVPAAAPATSHDDDEEIHRELERNYAAVQMQLNDLQTLMERNESRAPVVRREVIEKSGLTAEQKQALREIVK